MTIKRSTLTALALLVIWGCTSVLGAALEQKSLSASTTPLMNNESIEVEARRKKVPSGAHLHQQQQQQQQQQYYHQQHHPTAYKASAGSPGSPVNLFTPDDFQFYTLDSSGQLVKKQMTKQEIQGMIAAGAGAAAAASSNLPVDLSHHKTKIPQQEPKIADVVQNVQNVLKNELKKPVKIYSSGSSIPNIVNNQWSSMLPYILSGGSVDQQDVAQDTSILLPTLDSDPYVDVVPLQSDRVVPVYSAGVEQKNKVTSQKPAFAQNVNQKPVLLGNMALDGGILNSQDSVGHSPIQYNKPAKQPTQNIVQDAVDVKNNTYTKPTLYIPSSPSLQADAKDKYTHVHYQSVPIYSRPNQQDKVTTLVSETKQEATATVAPFKKPTYLTSATQRPLTTNSPPSTTRTTVRDNFPATIMNVGPMGGFKKPEIFHKPTPYRPTFEPINRLSTSDNYETTFRPIYTPMSQTTVAIESASPYRPVFSDKTNTVTFKPANFQFPVYEISSEPSSGLKVTIYPGNSFETETTRKMPSTPVFNVPTQPSTVAFTTRKMPEAVTQPSGSVTETPSLKSQESMTEKSSNVSEISKTTEKVTEKTSETTTEVPFQSPAGTEEESILNTRLPTTIIDIAPEETKKAPSATAQAEVSLKETESKDEKIIETTTSSDFKSEEIITTQFDAVDEITTESIIGKNSFNQKVQAESESISTVTNLLPKATSTLSPLTIDRSTEQTNLNFEDRTVEIDTPTIRPPSISEESTYSTIIPDAVQTTDLPKKSQDSLNEDNFNSRIEQTTIYPSTDDKIDESNDDAKQITTTENALNDVIKISLDEEASTIKVIPVYDDETLKYPTSASVPSKINTLTTQVTEELSSQTSTTGPSSTSFTTQNIDTTETALPGLDEAFNNYMKEHYDSKIPAYTNDEISGWTTFPTLSYRSKTATDLPAIADEATEAFSEQILDSTTILPYTDASEITTITNSDDYSNKQQSKFDEAVNIATEVPSFEKVETPIIYLNLASSDSTEKNATPKLPEEFITNSSLTRIKTKNSAADSDKVLPNVETNTPPAAELYTLSSENSIQNNIASSLTTGVEKSKPDELGNSNVQDTKNAEKPEDIQESVTVFSTKLDEKTTEAITSVPDLLPYVESSTNTFPTEIPKIDINTQIPEIMAMLSNSDTPSQTEEDTDLIKSTFIPPLEKINEVINQLQNSPQNSEHSRYDYASELTTTIDPSDTFETLPKEEASTEIHSLHPMIEYPSKAAKDSGNDTFSMLDLTSRKDPKLPIESDIPSFTTTKIPDMLPTPLTTVSPISRPYPTGRPGLHSTKGVIEKIKATIDKSAGRINLEDEKTKSRLKPTEPMLNKVSIKNKPQNRRPTLESYTQTRRPTLETYPPRKSTVSVESFTKRPTFDSHPTRRATLETYVKKNTKPMNLNRPTINKISTARPTSIKTTVPVPVPTSKTTIEQSMAKSDEVSKDLEMTTVVNLKLEEDEEAMEAKRHNHGANQQQIKAQIVSLDHSSSAIGLDQSSKGLDKDVADFLNLCNELSFRFWTLANSDLNPSRSVTMSPFGMLSTLAMIFLGARGLTSIEMNDILKLDEVVTFNPHLVFQNITDTVTLARDQGIENAAFVKALYADRLKVRRIIPFYKEQAQQFYEGAVVDINFSTAGDILRRRTNLLIRKQTGGRIKDFVKGHTVPLRSPLTALSANVFQTSCDGAEASSEGRDGEMYFAVAQTVKQRKLVPIPAVVWKSGVSAGYEPSLDATAVALGDAKKPVSLIMIMPGQQGLTAPGDNLERLEQRLFGRGTDNSLDKLLKVIIPRRVEVQLPKFSHRSIVNVTNALKMLGFNHLFSRTADLKGINGAGHDLYLADMIQMNLFGTCGDENKSGNRHLSETYPGSSPRHTRAWDKYQVQGRSSVNDHFEITNNKTMEQSDVAELTAACEDEEINNDGDGTEQNLSPSERRNLERIKQLRLQIHARSMRRPQGGKQRRKCRTRRQTVDGTTSDKPRMKMDKPFLYLIRHNLTGLILHIGRFNPKSQA
ncbi:uncharacterized protein LOC106648117 [Trichogramma pretiosum]|uniref:uncharacterized protein LOC106648117 n=1 Tax=Trichogramma pretiosum TaxID=7493 RepID=UPI0006C9B5F1|nr:uncharacterized protein LOC106648117 [Trichogramma pretiosum]